MWRRSFAPLLLIALLAPAGAPRNAREVVSDVTRTLGGADLKSIRYSGSGYVYFFGQAFEPGGAWPKFNLTSYTYLGDYQHGAAQEDIVRTQFENPPRGGGFQPVLGPQHWIFTLTGDSIWHVGSGAEFRPGAGVPSVSGTLEEHQARLALTPQGWIKAAMASKPVLTSKMADGKKWTVVSFTWQGKYKINGYIDEQNFLERAETWIPASYAVSGDLHVEVNYFGYKGFGGVKFPTKIIEKQKEFPVLEVNVTDVTPNSPAQIEVPAGSEKTPPTATGPDSQEIRETRKLADGVWMLHSRDENSIAVEFKDYVAVIEAPIGDQFSLAVIAKIKQLAPNKPIRYLINTHTHFDHWAGMRTYVAEGVTILTAKENVAYYNQAFHWPRTLYVPDALALHPKPLKIQPVDDKYVLTDGARSVEIFSLPCDRHAMGSVMVYTQVPNAAFVTAGDTAPSCLAQTLDLQKIPTNPIEIAPIHGGNVAPLARP